jgi:uncharacterized protein
MALLVCYMALEPLWIRTHVVKIQSADVPEAFAGYRIAFISDVHFGPYLRDARLRRVVRVMNGAEPDLVVMGGDYISYSAGYVQACFNILRDGDASDGVYCVLGNHDHWAGAALALKAIADSGFHSIDNSSFWIDRNGQRILVAGVGDWLEDRQLTDEVLQGASQGDFCILAAHNPDYFAETTNDRIDLALSGHTHGGQVSFFGLCAPILPTEHTKYRFGLYRIGHAQLYVTSGIGAVTPPLRFFCRPEVVIFELTR